MFEVTISMSFYSFYTSIAHFKTQNSEKIMSQKKKKTNLDAVLEDEFYYN